MATVWKRAWVNRRKQDREYYNSVLEILIKRYPDFTWHYPLGRKKTFMGYMPDNENKLKTYFYKRYFRIRRRILHISIINIIYFKYINIGWEKAVRKAAYKPLSSKYR